MAEPFQSLGNGNARPGGATGTPNKKPVTETDGRPAFPGDVLKAERNLGDRPDLSSSGPGEEEILSFRFEGRRRGHRQLAADFQAHTVSNAGLLRGPHAFGVRNIKENP